MEPIKITFLGTSGSTPQKERNFASVLLSFRGDNLLFDCPEGTQKQLMLSEHSLMKIQNVFISHMHADHFLGLFGWIATMTLNQRKEKLVIFAPRGGAEKIKKMLHEVVRPCFEVEYKEIKRGKILETKFFEVNAFPLKHDVRCHGFVFKENDKEGTFDRKRAEKLGIPPGPLYSRLVAGEKIKINGKTFSQKDVMDYSRKRSGRKIAIVSDTRPVKETVAQAKGADVLIHEATFIEEQKEKALESLHSTAFEAGEIAKKAKVKQLVLFHLSARNADEKKIFEDAKKAFGKTIVAKDLETISI
ncbi:MAG: ribonuclease Z [Candidatus Diapherotrites archaeon]|nr:ribonuclease Z [Candidatus Diapherotrites archaeon]